MYFGAIKCCATIGLNGMKVTKRLNTNNENQFAKELNIVYKDIIIVNL